METRLIVVELHYIYSCLPVKLPSVFIRVCYCAFPVDRICKTALRKDLAAVKLSIQYVAPAQLRYWTLCFTSSGNVISTVKLHLGSEASKTTAGKLSHLDDGISVNASYRATIDCIKTLIHNDLVYISWPWWLPLTSTTKDVWQWTKDRTLS